MNQDDAFLTGLEQLGNSGFALALGILHHREDAADAVQDSICQAIRKRSSYRQERGELKPWFLKIVRNRCLDLLRSRNRQEHPPDGWLENSPGVGGRPDEDAQRKELHEFVRQALADLPPLHREVLLLRDYHNLNYAEISEVLSVPKGTVMSRLSRAREELRKRVFPTQGG